MAHLMRVTLSDVARAAGLSIGGTSYALRGHPSIPPRTVQRVQRLAAELGYTPDLRISSLMATIRRRQPLPGRETLALVWIDTPRATEGLPVHLQHYIRVTGEAARRREVEAVQVHHLGPGGDEVLDELLLRVGAAIDFRQGAELRVEPKTRSTRVPVHLTSPVLRSRPSNTSAPARPASTPCPCRAG
jgi:transcriptional regulator with XRE-family HTH domain